MKQVAQNYRTGELAMLEVATPLCRPGGVLVRTEYSLVSAGTERMKVDESKMSLLGKARHDPTKSARCWIRSPSRACVPPIRRWRIGSMR